MKTKQETWLEEFQKAPQIWFVIDEDGDYTGQLYDSKEAANEELKWLGENRTGKYRVVTKHIHNLELAKARWIGFE